MTIQFSPGDETRKAMRREQERKEAMRVLIQHTDRMTTELIEIRQMFEEEGGHDARP